SWAPASCSWCSASSFLRAARKPEAALMTMRATGPFDVQMTPEAADTEGEGSALGRMAVAKTYHGDLEATARGTMLTAGTSAEGSGAYVAGDGVPGTV